MGIKKTLNLMLLSNTLKNPEKVTGNSYSLELLPTVLKDEKYPNSFTLKWKNIFGAIVLYFAYLEAKRARIDKN